MPEQNLDLRDRTKKFALRIISVCDVLGNSGKAGIISRQLIRCGTSVGAQFREAKRARSTVEFVSKVESAAQELEESMYWLELVIEGDILPGQKLQPLLKEADEIMAILVASAKTARESIKTDRNKRGIR